MAAPVIRQSTIKSFTDQIHDNVLRLPDYMGYHYAMPNCTQHHRAPINCTIKRTLWGYWDYQLTKRAKENGFNTHSSTTKVTCRTFGDNKICIEIITNHRNIPITKHLLVRLHYFCSNVVLKTITIKQISTKNQIAEIFTETLRRSQFYKLSILLVSFTKGTERCLHVTWFIYKQDSLSITME